MIKNNSSSIGTGISEQHSFYANPDPSFQTNSDTESAFQLNADLIPSPGLKLPIQNFQTSL
jgi:hypothetical protein